MAYRANGYTYSELTENNSNNPWSNNWLAVQGLNTYLIKSDGINQYSSNLGFYEVDNDLYVKEKGSINSYNFNIGTILYDKLSIGLTASYTNINYKMYSSYIEDFYYPNTNNHMAYIEQINNIKMKGTGFKLGIGAIYQPIDKLRLGISYHSPTWYNMKDYYQSDMHHDLNSLIGSLHSNIDNDYKDVPNPYTSPEVIYKCKLTTPDRWTFSAAGTIKDIVTISLDYELSNYKNMKEKNRHSGEINYNYGANDFIKEDFKTASTIRAGVEFNSIPYVPNLSIRAGYAFIESPMTKEMKNNEKEIVIIGANANYILDDHTSHYTFRLGYQFTKNFYADIAFVYKTQNSSLYNIPTITEGTGENTQYINRFSYLINNSI